MDAKTLRDVARDYRSSTIDPLYQVVGALYEVAAQLADLNTNFAYPIFKIERDSETPVGPYVPRKAVEG